MDARDRSHELLIAALARALAQPGEHRLYKAGKLDGLFPGRAGSSGDAAVRAVGEGLLERARVEVKGRTEIEWVRITPAGVEHLHRHRSPVQALHDLRDVLRANRQAVPLWLEEMRGAMREMEARLTADAAAWVERLAGIERQAAEALRRLEAAAPLLPEEVARQWPWAIDALNYLDRRRAGGAEDDCPLPELFAAVAAHHPGLSVEAFQDGMRQLNRRRAVLLRPADEMDRPEFALLDGDCVYYLARR